MPEARPLFNCHRLLSSSHFYRREQFGCVAAVVLLLAVASVSGCEKAPTVTDPAKAPWLLDPQMQINGLKNQDHRIRGLSAFNLGNMGGKAAAAIPELERLAKDDPEPKVRERAREAVEKLRGASK
jgi:hypothetical protein